jgi:uroporphyrin-3 C-methyltransferase
MPAAATAAATGAAAPRLPGAARAGLLLLFVICALLFLAVAMLWQRLEFVQSESVRRLQLAELAASEARAAAKQTAEELRSMQSRIALAEGKLQDYAEQREAIERLLADTATREQSRLLTEFDQLLTLAEQEAQIASSPQALLGSLKVLESKAALAPPNLRDRLRLAIAKDSETIRGAEWADRAQLLAKFDELAKLLEDVPLASEVKPQQPAKALSPRRKPAPVVAPQPKAATSAASAAARVNDTAAQETLTWSNWSLAVRAFFAPVAEWFEVRRIDSPEALLVSPEQLFWLRENLKLHLMSARLSLLSRQADSYTRSLVKVQGALQQYADLKQPRTQQALGLLTQLQAVRVTAEIPRPRETRAVIVATGGAVK